MEYKTVRFEVIETTNPYGWKWIVFLDSTKTGPALGSHVLMLCWMPNLPSTRRWKGGCAVRKASNIRGVWDEYLR